MAFFDRTSIRSRNGQPVGWREAVPADQIAALLKLEDDKKSPRTLRSKPKSKASERTPEDIYAQRIEDSKLWAKSAEGLIYRWSGYHWEETQQEGAETDAFLWLRQFSPEHAGNRKATACVLTARLTMPLLPSVPAGRCLIPCLDGWLELQGDRFVRVAPDKSIGVTHSIRAQLGNLPVGAEYIPGPVSGLFANYLDVSLPDAGVRSLIQEYVGYTLLPDSFLNLQKAMIFIGDGADGKGVLTGLVRHLHRRTCAMNLKNLEGFGGEGLIGATLALVDEGPSRNGIIDDERMKTMVSGDALDINRKHKPAITYSPVAKWIICANDTPRFGSAGKAIERRFIFAPWTASLDDSKRIPNLGASIAKTELKMVLDWALAGALALVARGDFELPEQALALKEASMRAMETVHGWAADANPMISTEAQTPKNTIYEDYADWCHDQGQGARCAEQFWRRLRQHLRVPDEQLHGPRISDKGKRIQTARILIHQPTQAGGVTPAFESMDEQSPF